MQHVAHDRYSQPGKVFLVVANREHIKQSLRRMRMPTVAGIDDVDVLAATLSAVARGVEDGDYEPTGLGTLACSYCGHKAICGPYQRFQEASNPIRKEAR